MAIVISWMVNVWLIISEVFEGLLYASMVDFTRRFSRGGDCRRQAPKVKQSVPSIAQMR